MFDRIKNKRKKRKLRHKRVRAKVFGTKEKPRMSVYKSLRNNYVQIINDQANETLLAFDDRKIKGTKAKRAEKLGKKIGEMAMEKGIKQVVFDRGGCKYHGRTKAIAQGARNAGLKI